MSATERSVAKPSETSLTAIPKVESLTFGFPPGVIAVTQAQYPDLRPAELARFLYEASRLGLDPASGRQVYCIVYNKNIPEKRTVSIQVAIDGFRTIAARSGKYDGSAEVEFGPDAETTYKGERETVKVTHPTWARATVWRRGASHSFTATVRWTECVKMERNGLPRDFYINTPYNQLGIRAEAAALRKAFPMELRGLRAEDEREERPGAVDADFHPVDESSSSTDTGQNADTLRDKTGEQDQTRPQSAATGKSPALPASGSPASTPVAPAVSGEEDPAIPQLIEEIRDLLRKGTTADADMVARMVQEYQAKTGTSAYLSQIRDASMLKAMVDKLRERRHYD